MTTTLMAMAQWMKTTTTMATIVMIAMDDNFDDNGDDNDNDCDRQQH